jgi:uncharacterized protein (DUF1501 family)
VAQWSPDAALSLSPQAEALLGRVMRDDPLFGGAMDEAIALSRTDRAGAGAVDRAGMMGAMQDTMRAARGGAGPDSIARFAAERLRGPARVAAFSLNGFDSHANQSRVLDRALDRLQTAILTLRDGLGPAWGRTTVLAMTEFGRTARRNGTDGTDHGTAGAMLLAGGALRGGRVLGDWPGLAEADLYDRRDLRPTGDVRTPAAWVMRHSFGLDRAMLERAVFPGLEMGEDPGLMA